MKNDYIELSSCDYIHRNHWDLLKLSIALGCLGIVALMAVVLGIAYLII